MNATEDRTYNGYTNYETWNVALWIDNEQGPQNYWLETAAQCLADAPNASQVAEKIWTVEQAAKFALADQLKEWHQENVPEISGCYADLLGAALSEVNWDEIAGNLLDTLGEQ